MWLIIGLVAILSIIGLIAFFKKDMILDKLHPVISWFKLYKKQLITFFVATSSIVGGGLALTNLDDGDMFIPEVEANMLIDSLDDYERLGYNLSKIDNPILYEEQVLCEGHMPIVYEFDMKNDLTLEKESLNDFVSTTEKYKEKVGDINYKFNILSTCKRCLLWI